MQCPYCGVALADGSRACSSCRAALTANCRHCGAEIAILARTCPSCGQSLTPLPKPAAPAPPVPAMSRRVPGERSVLTLAVLTIITCGFWGFVALWQIAEDINAHRGRRVLSPGVDLLLTLLTCGLWTFYVMYRYPTEMAEMQREEGLPASDLAMPCILLTFFGMPLIALLVLQHELNRHWQHHVAPVPAIAA